MELAQTGAAAVRVPDRFPHVVTGSPVPLWHIEKLESPRSVAVATANGLVLADGKLVTLPYIAAIPTEHPLFRHAIERGIEVREDGEVYGLTEVRRICGNDPVYYRLIRVNLTDLSAALDVTGVKSGLLGAETVSLLSSHEMILRTPQLEGQVSYRMRVIREELGRVTAIPRPDDPVLGRPGQHDPRTGGLVM